VRKSVASASENNHVILYSDDMVDSVLNTVLEHFANCRPITTLVASNVITNLVYFNSVNSCLKPKHQEFLEKLEQKARVFLQKHLDFSPDIFLEIFEDEIHTNKPVNIEKLIMDTSILFVPSQTPLTGIDFSLRLPCGDAEKSRKAIRDFLTIRRLRFKLNNQTDDLIPLAQPPIPVILNDVLDLQQAEVVSCVVHEPNGMRFTRFLVFDDYRLILVEPEPSRVGFGIVRLISPIEYVFVEPDKKDNLSLELSTQVITATSSKFVKYHCRISFEDNVRLMAASKHLETTRSNLKITKMKRLRYIIES